MVCGGKILQSYWLEKSFISLVQFVSLMETEQYKCHFSFSLKESYFFVSVQKNFKEIAN